MYTEGVYVIKSFNGVVKFGRSNKLKKRKAQYQVLIWDHSTWFQIETLQSRHVEKVVKDRLVEQGHHMVGEHCENVPYSLVKSIVTHVAGCKRRKYATPDDRVTKMIKYGPELIKPVHDVIEGIFRFVPCEGILTDGVCKFKFEVTRPGEKYFSPMNAVFYKTIGEFGFVSALLEYRITGNITKTGDTFIVQSCTPISARRYESFILYDMLDTGNYLHEQEKDAIVQNGYDIPTMERLHKVHMPEIHRKEGRVYYNFDIYNTLYKMTNDQSVFTLNLDDTRKAVDWIKGNPFKSCLHFSIGGKNYTCKPENVQSTIGVEFTELEIDAIKSYIDASSDGGRLPLGSNKDVVSVLEKAGYVYE